MKVLKNNCIKKSAEEKVVKIASYPRKHTCEMCSSELEYEETDLRMGVLGCMYIDCPCCGYDCMLDENENNITLTMDNVEFPVHFFHTSVENGAVDVCNDKYIREYISKAVDYFRKNKEETHWGGHITGNLYINVRRWSGDEIYEVTISKDFYSTEIPFEPADY